MRTWKRTGKQMAKRMALIACGSMIAIGSICCVVSFAAVAPADGAREMPQMIEQYTADRASLNRIYPVTIAPARMARLEKFDNDKLAMLAAMDFDKLSEEDQIDYLLVKTRLTADLRFLAMQRKQIEEMAPLLPFAKPIEDFLDRKREMKRPDAEKDAAALTQMVKQIEATRKQLDPKPHGTDGRRKAEGQSGCCEPRRDGHGATNRCLERLVRAIQRL
jgi:hypothetical protein